MKLKTPFGAGKSKPAPSAPLKARAQSARLYLQALEPRVLLDAAAAKTVQEAAHAPAPEPTDQAPDNHGALGFTRGVVDSWGSGSVNRRSGPGTGCPVVGPSPTAPR